MSNMVSLKETYERNRLEHIKEAIEIADFEYLIEGNDLLEEGLEEQFQQIVKIVTDLDKIKGIPSIEAAVDKAKNELTELTKGTKEGGIKGLIKRSIKSLFKSAKEKIGLEDTPIIKATALANIISTGVLSIEKVLSNTVGDVAEAAKKDKNIMQKTIEQYAGDKKDDVIKGLTRAFSKEGFSPEMVASGLKEVPYDLKGETVAQEIMSKKLSDIDKILASAKGLEQVSKQADPQEIGKELQTVSKEKEKEAGEKGKEGGEISKFKSTIKDVIKKTGAEKKIVKMVFSRLNKMGKLKTEVLNPWLLKYPTLLTEANNEKIEQYLVDKAEANDKKYFEELLPKVFPGTNFSDNEVNNFIEGLKKGKSGLPQKIADGNIEYESKGGDKGKGDGEGKKSNIDPEKLANLLKGKDEVLKKIAIKLDKDPDTLIKISELDEEKFKKFIEQIVEKKPKLAAWAEKNAGAGEEKIDLLVKQVVKDTPGVDAKVVRSIVNAIPKNMLKVESKIQGSTLWERYLAKREALAQNNVYRLKYIDTLFCICV